MKESLMVDHDTSKKHYPDAQTAPSLLPTLPRTFRRRSVLCAGGLALTTPGAILAQSGFPNRPIRLIVPFAAGGGTDIVARVIAQHMASALSQPFIVDNRTGAGGSIGSDAVAKAPPDGYMLLMATVSTHAINPALYAKLPFDPLRDFAPVSLLVRVPGIVVVNSKLPYLTFAQLLADMRSNPGKLTFGSQGVGGIGHLMGEMVNSQARVRSVHVPYRGAALAIQDLLAGNIDILYDTPPALLPHIQTGALRPLLVTASTRLPALPAIPTSAEAGFPDFVASTWNALLAPAGTPDTVTTALSRAAAQALRSPEVLARLRDLSAEPVGSTPKELGAFMQQELTRWTPIVKASGARLE